MKRKKGFTLVEILVAIIVIAILASLGVANYSKTIERARQRICESNLRTLRMALKIYAMDNDAIPASLSKLPENYIMLAKERVRLNEKKDFIYYVSRLMNSLHQWKGGRVWAQPFAPYYGDDINLITCPADPTPPPDGISYGINPDLTIDCLRLGTDILAIADCDHGDLSRGTAFRHRKGLFRQPTANFVTADGEVKEACEYGVIDAAKKAVDAAKKAVDAAKEASAEAREDGCPDKIRAAKGNLDAAQATHDAAQATHDALPKP